MADTDEKQPEEKSSPLSPKLEKIAKEIEGLSVLELSELVTSLQDRLGVSAMPTAAAPAADAPAEGGDQPAGGAAIQTVVLVDSGANKISVIKALREVDQNLGLKEAKDMTDKVPAEVAKDLKADDAAEAKKKLEEAGAKVELK